MTNRSRIPVFEVLHAHQNNSTSTRGVMYKQFFSRILQFIQILLLFSIHKLTTFVGKNKIVVSNFVVDFTDQFMQSLLFKGFLNCWKTSVRLLVAKTYNDQEAQQNVSHANMYPRPFIGSNFLADEKKILTKLRVD
jgi:hypothetical protein